MKTMESQNIKINGNIVITDVKNVRDYKGSPQGMVYIKNMEPKLVILVKAINKYMKDYWKPVCPS